MNGRHKIRIWTMWLVELLVASLLSGCNHHDETCCQLAEMDSLIYTNPRRVLVQLDSIDAARALSKHEQMHLELLRGAAMNKADSLFTTDSVMLKVAEYYDRHGSANERMQAHYTLGCAYRDMGNAPRRPQQSAINVCSASMTLRQRLCVSTSCVHWLVPYSLMSSSTRATIDKSSNHLIICASLILWYQFRPGRTGCRPDDRCRRTILRALPDQVEVFPKQRSCWSCRLRIPSYRRRFSSA